MADPIRAPLIIDVTHPDPAQGDPWPRHLCMPSVAWPAPVGAVLRPERASVRTCGPCTGNCNQGRTCPARKPAGAPRWCSWALVLTASVLAAAYLARPAKAAVVVRPIVVSRPAVAARPAPPPRPAAPAKAAEPVRAPAVVPVVVPTARPACNDERRERREC